MLNKYFIIEGFHSKNLDSTLIRNGRVDIKIELRSCDRFQISSIYEKITKKAISQEILNKIPEFKYKSIDIITHILRYHVCDMNTDNIMEEFYEI